ncbi:MAG: YihY/virulence factor BrkB family protein [Bacilli bacterium]|nr:YihY/virulence factor BrkB family protein [Bacilli bacterium]
MKKARDVVDKIFKILLKPEMRILPAHLAFYLFMTIIPLVALITTLAAALSISTEAMKSAILAHVPLEVVNILNSITQGQGINFNMIVFYFSAILLASNGAHSMINASNEIYKVTPNGILSRRIKAIFMTFILLGLFILLLIVSVFGTTLFNILKEVSGEGLISSTIQHLMIFLKYPFIILMLFLNIKIMYVISPDQEIPSNTTNKGSVFTTIGWILTTEIYAFYVEHFASYNVFYGSISNILIMMIWLYFLSYIYVFGMIINANDYRTKEEREKEISW